MPNYDLNGNPLPENTPGGGAPPPQQSQQQQPQQQQYDLAGNPLPQPGGSGQPPTSPYGQPQQPYGTPPPYGQPQGVWPPPAQNSQYNQGYPSYYPLDPSANKILGYSVLAFFCFGIILGPYSAFKAWQGISEISAGRANPADRGKLVAAMVCGILASIAAVILIIIRLAALGRVVSGH